MTTQKGVTPEQLNRRKLMSKSTMATLNGDIREATIDESSVEDYSGRNGEHGVKYTIKLGKKIKRGKE